MGDVISEETSTMECEPRLDQIQIRDLKTKCIIGINEDERKTKQEIIINLDLFVNFSKACNSDAIEDTVNYKTLKKEILSLVEGSSFYLLERLASIISKTLLAHPLIHKVRVQVQKPGALRFARTVAVELVRQKGDFKDD
jgi:D-erythro-7,8-dihydroneopterin triphosphate epimerase